MNGLEEPDRNTTNSIRLSYEHSSAAGWNLAVIRHYENFRDDCILSVELPVPPCTLRIKRGVKRNERATLVLSLKLYFANSKPIIASDWKLMCLLAERSDRHIISLTWRRFFLASFSFTPTGIRSRSATRCTRVISSRGSQ